MSSRLLIWRTSAYGIVVLAAAAYSFFLLRAAVLPDPRAAISTTGDSGPPRLFLTAGPEGISGPTRLQLGVWSTSDGEAEVQVTMDARAQSAPVPQGVAAAAALPVTVRLSASSQEVVLTCDTPAKRTTGGVLVDTAWIGEVTYTSEGTGSAITCRLSGAAFAAANATDSYYTFPVILAHFFTERADQSIDYTFSLYTPREPVLLQPAAVDRDRYGVYSWKQSVSVRPDGDASPDVIPEGRFRDNDATARLQWRLFVAGLVIALISSLLYAIVDAWLVYFASRRVPRNLDERVDLGEPPAARTPSGTGWPN